MINKISIDCLIFLDDDPVVFTEGIQKYHERHKSGKLIPPIQICHQHEDKYYARGGATELTCFIIVCVGGLFLFHL